MKVRAFCLFLGLAVVSSLRATEIAEFWRQTRERLAAEPMEASMEPLKESLPFKKCRVTLRSLGGVRFRALLALPVQGEARAPRWPVIVTTPGYGGSQQGVMLSECQRGYAVLQVFPRGQGESAELSPLEFADKLTGKLDAPEGAYYQGAYADVMRAIDFAVARPELDSARVALVATSQGGGMALAVASLDSRVKAVVAHVPFLCAMREAAHAPASLVKTLLDRAKRNDEAALSTLDYFDPRELVSQLRVPVLVSAGGRDETCPAGTIRAVFARVPGANKTLKFYPDLPHTSCVDFYNLTWTWLEQNFRPQRP